jgi:4-hydroxyphenylpyruvate dioxygenase
MNKHLINHGDGVRDVAFRVENTRAIFNNAVKGGAVVIAAPY